MRMVCNARFSIRTFRNRWHSKDIRFTPSRWNSTVLLFKELNVDMNLDDLLA